MTRLPNLDATGLLRAFSAGDRSALDRLMPLIYEQLRDLAHRHLRRERSGHLLSTTALVHEAYLKLIDINQVAWQDRSHFLAMASRAMRRLLVDYARERQTRKRGGDYQRVDLTEVRLLADEQVETVLALEEALQHLTRLDPRKGSVVEYRYFGGLTNEEIAAALGVSLATVKRDLTFARAWLARALGDDPAAAL
ncbi:sigma-70 family RNA polymerase sigma factor [Rhodocaloribacter litoris]|uniref:sigma-70 family RNA polymerase sigma factor n=1 Tax=Rhodocaloribacter litoris TaxID=2558931 RepID=UPI001E630F6E|nr:sigma-70 family RNA polymerase sigma factor [Rhodocaloribacter litoris]QXD15198.1 sigma-70 family RNA polymerase sigma factor [Rhodocaloribacter litoris]